MCNQTSSLTDQTSAFNHNLVFQTQITCLLCTLNVKWHWQVQCNKPGLVFEHDQMTNLHNVSTPSIKHAKHHALTHIVALHRSCLPNLRRWLMTVECSNLVVRQHKLQGHHCRPVSIVNSSRARSFLSRARHRIGCPTGCRCAPPRSIRCTTL